MGQDLKFICDMKNVLVTCLVGIGIFMTSCEEYKDVEVLSYDEMSLDSIDGDGIHLKSLVTINNPNKYDIKVQFEDVAVSVNNKFIGNAELKNPVKLEASSTQQYTIETKCTLPKDGSVNLGQLTESSLFGGGITLGVKGNIIGKAKGITKKVPIEVSRKIDL